LIDWYCKEHLGKKFTHQDFDTWLTKKGYQIIQDNGITALRQAIFISYASYNYVLTKNYRSNRVKGIETVLSVEEKQ
jgi:aryl-phospho-beta-D-glucosidase BglC (GH1 family)